MKKMTCEVCNGTDFVKDGGMFVCQSCGCKYTLEEARSLMQDDKSEGTAENVVQESSTASANDAIDNPVIDEHKKKIENLRTLARRAKSQSDSQNAANFYQQLLMEEPNDWEANFYTTFYGAHNIKIGEMGAAANRVSNCFDAVLRLIKQNIQDPFFQKAAGLEIALQVGSFKEMIMSNFNSHMGGTLEIATANLNNWVVPAEMMLITLGDKLISILDDPGTAEKMFDIVISDAGKLGAYSTKMKELQSIAQNRKKNAADIATKRKRAEADQKRKQYWDAHAEEKAALDQEYKQLDSEKKEIANQISNLEKKRDNVPAHEEYSNTERTIQRKTAELRSLGLFKGKEKKELQQQIDELLSIKYSAKKTMESQQNEIQVEIDPLKDQLKKIQKRINEITQELNKDR